MHQNLLDSFTDIIKGDLVLCHNKSQSKPHAFLGCRSSKGIFSGIDFTEGFIAESPVCLRQKTNCTEIFNMDNKISIDILEVVPSKIRADKNGGK